MKKIKIIILTALICIPWALKAQDEAFEKLADMKGVSVVHISKSMLNMMPKMDMKANNINIGEIAGKLNSLTILSGENDKSSQAIRKEINAIVKKGNYEQTMLVKDEDSKTVFYFKPDKKGGHSNEMIMISDDGDEISVIRISGDISAKDIQNITSGSHSRREREEADRHRQQALREAQRAREEAAKHRQQALKEAAKHREQALKEAQRAREEAARHREHALQESQKSREEALRNAQKAREEAGKHREQALKDAQKAREQALKESVKAREKALREAQKELDAALKEQRKNFENSGDYENKQALQDAEKAIKEAQKMIEKQLKELEKKNKNQ